MFEEKLGTIYCYDRPNINDSFYIPSGKIIMKINIYIDIKIMFVFFFITTYLCFRVHIQFDFLYVKT